MRFSVYLSSQLYPQETKSSSSIHIHIYALIYYVKRWGNNVDLGTCGSRDVLEINAFHSVIGRLFSVFAGHFDLELFWTGLTGQSALKISISGLPVVVTLTHLVSMESYESQLSIYYEHCDISHRSRLQLSNCCLSLHPSISPSILPSGFLLPR